MAFTCLHTADWQLGLKLNYIPGDAGAQARLLRYQAVTAIAEVAKQRAVDAVIVSGDVLDSNAAGPETLQRAREALAAFAPIPVLLMPGNHDHAGPACALARLTQDGSQALGHVVLLLERKPYRIADTVIYPCPLLRRHEVEDPTGWLPPRTEGEGIRITVAHGGVIDFAALAGDDIDTPNLIELPGILAKGFDYVALGDWHGTLRVDPRAWYSGTPEATRFKERDPGNVLVVSIAAPGATPEVEAVRVASTSWEQWAEVLSDDDGIDRLQARFLALSTPTTTCIELRISGTVSLAGRTRIEALLTEWGQRCMLVRSDTTTLAAKPSEADLAAIAEPGLLNVTIERLRANTDESGADALHLLHRLLTTTSA